MALQMNVEQVKSNFLYCSINNFIFPIQSYLIGKNALEQECLDISTTEVLYLSKIYDAIKINNPINVIVLNHKKERLLDVLASQASCKSFCDEEMNIFIEASFILDKEEN